MSPHVSRLLASAFYRSYRYVFNVLPQAFSEEKLLPGASLKSSPGFCWRCFNLPVLLVVPPRDEESGVAATRRAFGAVETSRLDSDSDEEDEHREGLFSDTESQYEEAVVSKNVEV